MHIGRPDLEPRTGALQRDIGELAECEQTIEVSRQEGSAGLQSARWSIPVYPLRRSSIRFVRRILAAEK